MLKDVLERQIKELEEHLEWLYYLLETETFDEPKDPTTLL
jgi:hypothetical protein